MRRPAKILGLFLAVALAVAGAFGAGAAWTRGRARSTPAEPVEAEAAAATNTALVDDVAALRRRLARLERDETARGESAGTAMQAKADEAASAAAHAAAIEKLKKSYTPELEAKIFTTYFAHLDELRRAEGVDAAWARDVEATLRRSLHGEGAIATLDAPSVACGRTLCRIELQASDPIQQRLALSELLEKLGPQLPQASVHVPPGSGHMTAYLARDGTNLPAMAPPEQLVADLP